MSQRRLSLRARRLRSGLALAAVATALVLAFPAVAHPAGAPLPRVTVAPGSPTFQTEDGRPFVPFGVTYFRPGTGWAPQVWKQLDEEATRRDFTRLRELGANCVRVFLTFGSIYPEPGKLDPEGIAKLDRFLELAEGAGLYVHPTGPDHWEGVPEWARADRFADERLLEAQVEFWRLLAARYRGRAVIFAYDLLNEPAVQWTSPAMAERWPRWIASTYPGEPAWREAWGDAAKGESFTAPGAPAPKEAPGSRALLDYQRFRESLADEWTRRQAEAIRAADPRALVTVGLVQWSVPAVLPGIQHYAAFKPSRIAEWLDFLEVHFYPLAQGAYEYRSEEDEARNLAYLEATAWAVASAAPAKPLVIAEYGWYGGGKPSFDGGRHPEASEEAQARWDRRLVETTEGIACGWLHWGLHDHPGARDPTELIGLLRPDGAEKAWAREFRALAGSLAGRHVELPAARRRALQEGPALDWDAAITSPLAAERFRERQLEAWRARQSAGAAPTPGTPADAKRKE